MALNQFNLLTENQLRTAVATTTPTPTDEWLNEWIPLIEDEVEKYLTRTLRYSAAVVEWFSPSDDNFLLLSRRPVHAVTEVRQDDQGGFGQKPNTFGTDTILAVGDEYYLELDGEGLFQNKSESGTLWRVQRTWGYSRRWTSGLLTSERVPALGTVKVTYEGGYKISDDPALNEMPGVVSAAVAQAAGVWYTTLLAVGVKSSESVTGYSWSQILGFNLGDNIFASIRAMLTSLRTMRPGGGSGRN